jgi:hypothetical protein
MGQAYRMAGQLSESIDAYNRYLGTAHARRGAAARRAVADLEWSLQNSPQAAPAQAEAPPPPPAAPEPEAPAPVVMQPEEPVPAAPSTHPGRGKRIAGLTVGAVGLAALGVGVGFAVMTQRRSDELSALSDQRQPYDPGKASQGRTFQILEGVFLGIGGAALVTGVVLYALGRMEGRRPRETARAARIARAVAGGTRW